MLDKKYMKRMEKDDKDFIIGDDYKRYHNRIGYMVRASDDYIVDNCTGVKFSINDFDSVCELVDYLSEEFEKLDKKILELKYEYNMKVLEMKLLEDKK